MAIEAFARALRQIPTIIADNAGLDGTELVSQLRAAHHKGQNTMGLDIENGSVGDITDLAVTESFQVKSKVLLSAAEAAEMILRVDEIIRSAPRYGAYLLPPFSCRSSLRLLTSPVPCCIASSGPASRTRGCGGCKSPTPAATAVVSWRAPNKTNKTNKQNDNASVLK
jgi:hypothetical protein